MHFAAAFPAIEWQPTDPDPEARASIDAHREEEGSPNLLPALHLDVLVVDEASMIDLEMMANLLDALPPHARMVLLGESVGMLGFLFTADDALTVEEDARGALREDAKDILDDCLPGAVVDAAGIGPWGEPAGVGDDVAGAECRVHVDEIRVRALPGVVDEIDGALACLRDLSDAESTNQLRTSVTSRAQRRSSATWPDRPPPPG